MNEIILKVLAVIIALVVIALVGAVPVYFLWNWLMPEIFGLKEITLMQSIGLLFLSGFLLKGSSSGSSSS